MPPGQFAASEPIVQNQPVSAPLDSRPIVLIVDDELKALSSLPRLIRSDLFAPLWVPDEQQGLHTLQEHKDRIWLIIIDQKSSGLGGAGFRQVAKRFAPWATYLITTPLGPVFYHRHSIYELNGVNLKEDIDAILSAIADKIGLTSSEPGRAALRKRRSSFGPIIGCSREMNTIYDLIQTVERSAATVLIQGESGTGKELIAQTIHRTSSRKERQFVAVNCGAMPTNLVESELFGHEKGAFTSAHRQHQGKFEHAHGGTLFLDEIGELEPEVQIKLLRVIQEKEFQRVGGGRTLQADCRLIAATSRNLKQDVANGRFREDLFYRINVIPMWVPPLRERRTDIPLLLEHFFSAMSHKLGRTPPRLAEEASEVLEAYSYPGNVRELINVVERLCVICSKQVIRAEDLPEELRELSGPQAMAQEVLRDLPPTGCRLQEVERELIAKTLHLTSGNKVDAARKLGITRRLLYLRLEQYGL